MINKIVIEKNSAYLITDYSARRYFSGIDLDEGVLVIHDTPAYFIDERYYYAVDKKVKKAGITPIIYKNYLDVKEFLKNRKVKKLFVDFDHTTLTQNQAYIDNFNLPIFDCSKEIKKARSVKGDKEIESIKKACQITQKAFYEVFPFIKAGITEIELKDLLESKMLELGAEKTSFETIVAFGKNSAIPHHKTSTQKLKNNSPILVDMGCTINGYCSDFTRTIFFGKPSKQFINCYENVKNAHLLATEKITANLLAKDGDKIARDYFISQGAGEKFTHSLGHGVGLDIHENPYLNTRSTEVLQDKMVFTIEPGLYYENKFGVRIEDTVMLQNGTITTFYTDEKDLIVIN